MTPSARSAAWLRRACCNVHSRGGDLSAGPEPEGANMDTVVSLDQAVRSAIGLLVDVMCDEVRAPRFAAEFGGGTSFTRARDARGSNALRRIDRVNSDEWCGIVEDGTWTWGGCTVRLRAVGVDLKKGRRWCDPILADGPTKTESANQRTIENRQKTPGQVDFSSARTQVTSNATRIAESFTTELTMKAGGEAAQYSVEWKNSFTAEHEAELSNSLEHSVELTRHPDLEPWSQVEVSDITRRGSGHVTTHFKGPLDAGYVGIYDGNILSWESTLGEILSIFRGDEDAWGSGVHNNANQRFKERRVGQTMLDRLGNPPSVEFSRTDRIDSVVSGDSVVGPNKRLPGTPPWADEMRGRPGFEWLDGR